LEYTLMNSLRSTNIVLFQIPLTVVFSILCFSNAMHALASYPVVEWVEQIGTSAFDQSSGISADELGNVYIVGSTNGSLASPNRGQSDTFVAKYNSEGSLLWVRQFAGVDSDLGLDISAKEAGAVYFSGSRGSTPPGSSQLVIDAFVGKYDSAGNLEWIRTFATEFADRGQGVAADGIGNVYLAGGTGGGPLGNVSDNQDAYVRKYDSDGALVWTELVASAAFDSVNGAATDASGNVYIGGITRGSLASMHAGGHDAFVSKLDSEGTHLWTRQFGTISDDYVAGVDADSLGNVYLVGTTFGNLDGNNAGFADAFVRKYDSAGNLQWAKHFGTTGNDLGFAIASDGLGNVYFSVATGLGPSPTPNFGNEDVFVYKLNAEGSIQWSIQLGTQYFEQGFGMTADGLGNVYASGRTLGSFGGPNQGNMDAFTFKIADVPEPTCLAMMPLLLALCASRRIGAELKVTGVVLDSHRG
jgi:hypothetical protein